MIYIESTHRLKGTYYLLDSIIKKTRGAVISQGAG